MQQQYETITDFGIYVAVQMRFHAKRVSRILLRETRFADSITPIAFRTNFINYIFHYIVLSWLITPKYCIIYQCYRPSNIILLGSLTSSLLDFHCMLPCTLSDSIVACQIFVASRAINFLISPTPTPVCVPASSTLTKLFLLPKRNVKYRFSKSHCL